MEKSVYLLARTSPTECSLAARAANRPALEHRAMFFFTAGQSAFCFDENITLRSDLNQNKKKVFLNFPNHFFGANRPIKFEIQNAKKRKQR